MERGKKNTLQSIKLFSILSAFLVFGSGVAASANLRQYQPVCFTGEQLPAFQGKQVSKIFAFSYNKKTAGWKQIPFQIDEIGLEISINFYDSTKIDTVPNYFGELNGVLESEEEVLFMFKDAGDKAPDSDWIADNSARDFPRYEIQIKDPLNPYSIKYVYIYYSNSLQPDPALADYVQLTEASSSATGDDGISGLSYFEGHNENGFTVAWQVPESHQGTNENFLDLLKMRIKVQFGFNLKIMESDAMFFRRLDYVDGPIRLIRRLNYTLTLEFLNAIIGIADFTTYYYPYHTDALGPTKNFSPDWGISYIRQSFDLNQAGVGMRFYNPFNYNVTLDGIPDEGINKTLYPNPELNWHLITGTPGSVLFSYQVPSIGVTQELYYFDNVNEISGDDFPRDSGDGLSIGDIGVAISGEKLAGNFGMSYEALFLGANQEPIIANDLLEIKQNALTIWTVETEFDRTPPGQITDLKVSDFTHSSITLNWTAPAEDNLEGGKVAGYEIRFSKFPLLEDLEEWLIFTRIPELQPQPLEPGTTQTFTITGLEPEQTYYVVIRSQDDMGYWSEYSNPASGTSFPVELVNFAVSTTSGGVELRWQTASEQNNLGFEIQKRKIDGTSGEWQKAGFVQGNGTTAVPHAYSFVDKNLEAGTYEYRLKQIDTNGQFSISATRQIEIAGPYSYVLEQNYPNPFNPKTTIEFVVPAQAKNINSPVIISIYNTLGDQVRSFKFTNPASGKHQVEWDATNEKGQKVAAGIYYLRLAGEEFTQTKKMLLLP